MMIEVSLVQESVVVPIAVLALSAIAVFTDVKSRKIPNWLTVSAFTLGLVFHLVTGGLSGLVAALCGFSTGFGLLLILFLIGGGGGGDVKLMGALGTWLGAWPTFLVFVGSAFFVVLIMIATLVWRVPQQRMRLKSGESILKQTLPYAIPVAMALVSFLLFESFVPAV